MIRPPGFEGVVFTEAGDGDMRSGFESRHRVSAELGIPGDWAMVRQVHGNAVIEVDTPGIAGPADAIWTTSRDLPVAILTADCFGVVLVAEDAVGIAHAGWRGVDDRVVPALMDAMSLSGNSPQRAAIGPGIGPCCFEVGEDVATRFEPHTSSTTWATGSVDLRSAIKEQLVGLEVWDTAMCTHHDGGLFSFRQTATDRRLAALAWRA